MRQPEPQSAVTSFLSALADDLSAPPDEMTSWRHVTAAAAIVNSERSAASSRAVRLTVAALISLIGLGTGGVAMAGGLPAPIQEVAADVGRAMPLPISIPYSTPVEASSPASADAQRRPMDGEIDQSVERVADTEAGTSSAWFPSPSKPVGEPHLGQADEPHDTSGQDLRTLEPDDDDVVRASERVENDDREAGEEGRSHRDERPEDDRSDDDRSDDDRSDDDRSDDDRSDDDRSDDDRSDDDRSDRD